MIRNQVLEIAESNLLSTITELYGLNDYIINVIEGHEGGRNLAYFCENEEKGDKIIRISFLTDRNSGTFGMVHFDYSDGNYMIDYVTGNIMVFDFDNACFCWYMFDLANVWLNGVGWVQFESDIEKRKQFMKEYFETVLKGYKSETNIDDKMLENLQLFIKVNIMEGIIDTFEVMQNNGEKPECDELLSYLIKCMEDEISYKGFFNEIYSCDEPFEYEAREI